MLLSSLRNVGFYHVGSPRLQDCKTMRNMGFWRENNDKRLKMREISCLNPQHSAADNLKSLTAI